MDGPFMSAYYIVQNDQAKQVTNGPMTTMSQTKDYD